MLTHCNRRAFETDEGSFIYKNYRKCFRFAEKIAQNPGVIPYKYYINAVFYGENHTFYISFCHGYITIYHNFITSNYRIYASCELTPIAISAIL